MTCLGVILARGGSKRVPGKNMKDLGGRPLIVWSIAAGMWATKIDRLVVSSDSDEILECADDLRVETIKRPPELASDTATSYEAMLHALDNVDETFDYLCLLQPTSPFRLPIDIDYCVDISERGEMPAVVSVTRGENVPNGAVYVGRTDWLRDGGNFDGPAVMRYYMPRDRGIDIDTPDDFAMAEAMV